jgi:ribose 5-phosphate isomerase A
MPTPIIVLDDPSAVAVAAARRFAEVVRAAVDERGRAVVALPGGTTPLEMYLCLASPPWLEEVPWSRVHVFWVDERLVERDDPFSHFGGTRSALLAGVPLPNANVHAVDTALPPKAAAEAYEKSIRTVLGNEPFDLIVLGMGPDGHVASVYPGTQALYETDSHAIAQWVPQVDGWRITLTLSTINSAREVMGLVIGPEKAPAVADLATGMRGTPAARVTPAGRLTWYTDRAAAGLEQDHMKRAAARSAVGQIRSGMRLGLGTGSTAALVLEEIGARLARGDLVNIAAIPTSTATTRLAERLGIPLLDPFGEWPPLDLALDGADQVDPNLSLIKGGGGALLREKIVAAAAGRFVVVVDESKQVAKLGTGFPLPIEVTPFGWQATLDNLAQVAGTPQLRGSADAPYVTDNGNYVIDCEFEAGIDDAAALDRTLLAVPGVVTTGLFIGLADTVYVGTSGGVEVLTPRKSGH